jgi:hypothetical protein
VALMTVLPDIMSASKKRKYDDIDSNTIVYIKINKDGTASAVLGDQYRMFPKPLQDLVVNQVAGMSSFEYTSVPAQFNVSSVDSSTCEVFEGSYIMHLRNHEAPKIRSVHDSIGLANLAAMDRFMEIELVSREKGKEKWVELDLESQLENPLFDEQHSLRPGDLGWGFDKNGGISLCAASRIQLYVQYDSVCVVVGKPTVVDIS